MDSPRLRRVSSGKSELLNRPRASSSVLPIGRSTIRGSVSSIRSDSSALLMHESLLSGIRFRRSSSSWRVGISDTGAYCVCDTSGSVLGLSASIWPPPLPCSCRARPCFFDSTHGQTQLRRQSATFT
uniref:Uncharacterized protein n=1 Tax=Anopheles coluzzii TaxID=1518534 RepID=A0A8W7P5W2_ANOCL